MVISSLPGKAKQRDDAMTKWSAAGNKFAVVMSSMFSPEIDNTVELRYAADACL